MQNYLFFFIFWGEIHKQATKNITRFFCFRRTFAYYFGTAIRKIWFEWIPLKMNQGPFAALSKMIKRIEGSDSSCHLCANVSKRFGTWANTQTAHSDKCTCSSFIRLLFCVRVLMYFFIKLYPRLSHWLLQTWDAASSRYLAVAAEDPTSLTAHCCRVEHHYWSGAAVNVCETENEIQYIK